ncbi:MAG: hypothetical protein N2109_04615 [Fimbriimonadales bacterium]|nr:hypothetical protein [Fimbriimonadales bacterium]
MPRGSFEGDLHMRSFTTEGILATLLAGSAMLVYSGFATIRSESANLRALWLGEAQIVLGAASGLAALAAGLAVAFGIGPRFLARRVEGVVVSRTVFSDGEIFEDGDPELLGGRCYVTLWQPVDQHLTELWCEPQAYRRLRKGCRARVRALGRRLVAIERAVDDSA